MIYLCCWLILFVALSAQTIYPWTCTSYDISLTVGTQMTPVTCECNTNVNGRIAPTLPAGLIYTVESEGYTKKITISGTPSVGLQKTVFSVGYNKYVSTFTLQILGQPHYLSYGFKNMNLYKDVPLEPIPARVDVAITTFTITPSLPTGLTIDASTGTISGKTSLTLMNSVHNITASNSFGSVTTSISFNIYDTLEMSMDGFVACYWAGITECLVPSYNYFYKNPAQYCKMESAIDFSDTWASEFGSVWPGLDYRFLDYYSAYMYGYLNILVAGTYHFYLTSDDGALFSIESLETITINREGCRGSGVTEGSVTLNAGKTLFVIRFFEFNEAAVLKLEYESTDLDIAKTVADTRLLKVGGRGPTFIEYPLITGFVNADIITYQPTMSSGGATQWSVAPALPQGITMNPTNGFISGRPVTVSNTVHTITATGYIGSAEAILRVVIANQPIAGFYTKYYKITDASFCSYKALSGNQIDIKVVKIDESINHPATNPIIPWTGLTADFSSNFYVIWEGYIHHDAMGEWGLRITCDDGCKLLSTNNNELINHWGCHANTPKETNRAISSNGYYYYKIEYQQSGGNGGMVLEWRKPNEGWTTVPADHIFHSPPTVVSYHYEMAHYFVGVNIEQNAPIFFTSTIFTSFSVSPALPQGLSINNGNGFITGVPTTPINIGYYTVTCISGSTVEKVVLAMDVIYVLPPSGIVYKQNGATVSTVSLIAFVEIDSISPQVPPGIEVTAYSITPELPQGLSINSATGIISGKPTESKETTTYMVSIVNSGGSFFTSIIISVSGCKGMSGGSEWTNSFYTIKLITGAGTISIQDADGATIMCGKGQVSSSGHSVLEQCSVTFNSNNLASITLCANPTEMKNIYISCTTEGGCKYQLVREDGHFFPLLEAYSDNSSPPFIKQTSFPSTLTPLTKLTITPTEINVYSGYEMMPVFIYPNGAYKSITISPYLAEGISSMTEPHVRGSVSGTGKQSYTITATGDVGTATAVLTLNFEICSEENGVSIFTFEMKTYSYTGEQSYSIISPDNINILSVDARVARTVYTNTMCLSSGSYVVKMKDSYGDGWGPTSDTWLRVKDSSNVLINEFTFQDRGKEKTDVLYIKVVQTSKVEWKVKLDGDAGRKWYEYKNEDYKSWETKTNGEMGEWNQITTYFVHEFNIEDAYQYPLVQFSVYFRDGIIVYLNGEQVYSRNLPNSVNHKTKAISQYDDYYQRIGTAPGYILKDGRNILSIEYHRFESTQGKLIWRAYVIPLSGTCITRIDGGTIMESAFFNQATETAAKAWDRNPGTNWIENGLPAWTTYTYNYDRVEWVNKIILGSALRYPESDPTEITISGSNNGIDWDIMKVIKKSGIWQSRGESVSFMMMDHMNAYGSYKVEITNTVDKYARTGLSIIDLQSCQLVYCTKDGDWPGTLSGNLVTINCAKGFIGERTRRCGSANLKPSWEEADEMECRSLTPPKKQVFIDLAISITNITAEMMINRGAEILKNTIANSFDILLSKIEAWKVKDVTDNSLSVPILTAATWIRITASTDEATKVLKDVTNGLFTVEENCKKYNEDIFLKTSVFSFYLKPMLSERKASAISITLIIILILLLIIVCSFIGFYIWVRTKSKKSKNGAKQLRSANHSRKVNAVHLKGSNDVRI